MRLSYIIVITIVAACWQCKTATPSLSGSQWKVIELHPGGQTSSLLPTKEYVLAFKSDATLNIKLDINNCFSGYALPEAGKINISPLACTKACCDSDLATQIARSLQFMTAYTIDGDRLELSGQDRLLLERL
ncbi:MAG: META domain-containing protein [Saprospiraceae bacterium]|jgi:heat shock protein HslJ|nr:META domain-containing protein [Saprospiraceae bacterium]